MCVLELKFVIHQAAVTGFLRRWLKNLTQASVQALSQQWMTNLALPISMHTDHIFLIKSKKFSLRNERDLPVILHLLTKQINKSHPIHYNPGRGRIAPHSLI